jgi:5-formyltetrahydrofolate cyclo-ligase
LTPLLRSKAAARDAALKARVAAHAAHPGAPRLAAGHALEVIAQLRATRSVAGYLPIRNELDPLPAMLALAGLGYAVGVPVIVARDQPVVFRSWTPGVETERGAFGVEVPKTGAPVEPDVLLVPMLAFDRRGHRLGYGGGFYDRTIAALRSRREIHAFGFAYAAQELPVVPDSETDMRLDAIVTEEGVIWPADGNAAASVPT